MVSTSIIVPLHGGLVFTQACHAALRATLAQRDDVEIVYVDNASPDDTATWLASIGDEAVIVTCDTNRNFSGGCNLGVDRASGDRIVLLNNDTEPQPGWLDALEAQLDDASVGIVGSLLTYPDGTVQHAGVAFPAGQLPEHAHVGIDPDDDRVRDARDVQAVTAACCALLRTTWDLLGGLDEGYVNGMEDMDLCLRARDAGLRIVYEPAARIVHHESRTEGRFHHATSNIQRFLAQHGAMLVPDAHVFDALAGIDIAPQDTEPTLDPTLPRGVTNAALRHGDSPWAVVAGAAVEQLDLPDVSLDARTVIADGSGEDGWLAAPRGLVERLGGFDLTLPAEAARVDWLDRARLFGAHVITTDPALVAAPWSCTDRERDLAVGVEDVRIALLRRWGRCRPEQRLPARYEPLTDAIQARDALVEVDVRARALLISTDAVNLEATARALFSQVGGAVDTSVVVRVSPNDEDAHAALERAADWVGDRPLPDVVVAESGSATEVALAAACTDVAIAGDAGERMRLRSIARAAGVGTYEVDLDALVSDQRS